MIKKIAVFLTFVALGMLCAAVAQAKAVYGEGRYMEQKLTHLTPFHSIDVRADVHVELWQQPRQSVTLSGKHNLVTLAGVRVEDNTLIIDFKRPVHVKGTHTLHVSITLPELKALAVKGKGRVRMRGGLQSPSLALLAADSAYVTGDSIMVDNLRLQALNKAEIDLERLQVKELEAAAFDKAEIELSGHAQKAHLTNNGRSDIDAADLRMEHAQVAVNAKGDIEAFVTRSLKAYANGSGEIKYYGQPEITRNGNTKKIQPAFAD